MFGEQNQNSWLKNLNQTWTPFIQRLQINNRTSGYLHQLQATHLEEGCKLVSIYIYRRTKRVF